MIRDTLLLAYVATMALLFGALIIMKGLLFFLPLLVLYSLLFGLVAGVVYVGVRWLHLRPQSVYVAATLGAAGFVFGLLTWGLGDQLEEPAQAFYALGLVPYLLANAAAYSWVTTRKDLN